MYNINPLKFYSKNFIMKLFKINHSQSQYLLKNNFIPNIKINRHYRIMGSAIIEFIKRYGNKNESMNFETNLGDDNGE